MSRSTTQSEAVGTIRDRLIAAGARLLSSHGWAGLSARRLAAEVNTSTITIYTHFGGIPGLVDAIVQRGLERLAAQLSALPATEDPVTDLAWLARVYRDTALSDPHMYGVMFGGVGHAHFGLPRREIDVDSLTLGRADAHVRRCLRAGRFRWDDHREVTVRLWAMLHGFVMLEIAGYGLAPDFDDFLLHMFLGAGDTLEPARHSVRDSLAPDSRPDTSPSAGE